jgi:hypothetical protein
VLEVRSGGPARGVRSGGPARGVRLGGSGSGQRVSLHVTWTRDMQAGTQTPQVDPAELATVGPTETLADPRGDRASAAVIPLGADPPASAATSSSCWAAVNSTTSYRVVRGAVGL